LQRSFFGKFQKLNEQVEEVAEKADCIVERVFDVQECLMHIATGKMNPGGIEHQYGGDNKKKAYNPF
jgi:hypothetical protein